MRCRQGLGFEAEPDLLAFLKGIGGYNQPKPPSGGPAQVTCRHDLPDVRQERVADPAAAMLRA